MKHRIKLLPIMILSCILILIGCHQEQFREAIDSSYGILEVLPKSWQESVMVVAENNDRSHNHEFMKQLDPNYLHMVIEHPESDKNHSMSFVLFNVKAWNDNASIVAGEDLSRLPPLVYFDEKYVYSVDSYDYDVNRNKYDEVIEILYGFDYPDSERGGYRVNELVTIEADKIIYQAMVDEIFISWRSILYDNIKSNGNYTIEKKVNDKWMVVEGYQDALNVANNPDVLSYGFTPLEEGHYRISAEYLRSSLYGLMFLNPKLYMVSTEFDVGQTDIKRYDVEGIEGVGLETEYEIYTEDSLKIRCKWFNTLNDSFLYGNFFSLEKLQEGRWMPVDFGEIAFTDEGIILDPYSESWHTYDMSWILDGLDRGSYRIKTDILRETLDGEDFGPGNYPSYNVYAPFEIRDTQVKRDMTELFPDAFFYKSATYGFAVQLTDDWKGVKLVEVETYLEHKNHDLYLALDGNYKIIHMQYPDRDLDSNDIWLVLFERNSWNTNAHEATEGDLDQLPDIKYSNKVYLFSTDVYYYDSPEAYKKALDLIDSFKIY